MNIRSKTLTTLLAATAALGGILAPLPAVGQSLKDLENELKRRQTKKNEWRNIAIGAGALGIWGLLKGDNTLFFAGSAGALYSLHRYEQDRKSQSKTARARAQVFSRRSFTRNGVRYVRKSTVKNGKRYYYFAKAR